jgi:hypothetical protein
MPNGQRNFNLPVIPKGIHYLNPLNNRRPESINISSIKKMKKKEVSPEIRL